MHYCEPALKGNTNAKFCMVDALTCMYNVCPYHCMCMHSTCMLTYIESYAIINCTCMRMWSHTRSCMLMCVDWLFCSINNGYGVLFHLIEQHTRISEGLVDCLQHYRFKGLFTWLSLLLFLGVCFHFRWAASWLMCVINLGLSPCGWWSCVAIVHVVYTFYRC